MTPAARRLLRATNAEIVEHAGTGLYHRGAMANIKLFFDYKPNEDDYRGPENRRYWLVNTKTEQKIRITAKQYDKLLSSWEDLA